MKYVLWITVPLNDCFIVVTYGLDKTNNKHPPKFSIGVLIGSWPCKRSLLDEGQYNLCQHHSVLHKTILRCNLWSDPLIYCEPILQWNWILCPAFILGPSMSVWCLISKIFGYMIQTMHTCLNSVVKAGLKMANFTVNSLS